MSAGAVFGAKLPEAERERERERDESAVLTHLTTTPIGAQRSLITSVPSELTRTPFPSIRFDPAPSPKETRFALNAGNRMPDPNPILCLPRQPPRETGDLPNVTRCAQNVKREP